MNICYNSSEISSEDSSDLLYRLRELVISIIVTTYLSKEAEECCNISIITPVQMFSRIRRLLTMKYAHIRMKYVYIRIHYVHIRIK